VLLAALPLPGRLSAQVDTAVVERARAAAESAVAAALAQCTAGVTAVQQAIDDPNHKLQGSCQEIGNALQGGSFEAALGVVPIALDHVRDYVVEQRQDGVRKALLALGEQLRTGSRAQQRFEALQELASRVEQLAGLGAADDASSLLSDLAATAGRVGRSDALPRAELARLQQQLARRRLDDGRRVAAECLLRAQEEMALLRQAFGEIRGELAVADQRDRGVARFDDAARNILTALARVPADERRSTQQELDKLQAEVDTAYRAANAAATVERIRNSWEFTADEFAGWEEEAAEITAAGYVTFDPPSVDRLNLPRTLALLQRVHLWLAFVGQDADYLRNRDEPPVAAFTRSILERRDRAYAKLLPLARAVVDGMAAIEIGDDTVRGRLQTLADWDLPMALQNHPEQAALVARVHALLDAHDRRTLGDEAALLRIREQALAAADGLWSRYQQWLPVQGGFEPTLAQLFVGKMMRLEGVWPRSAEFEHAPGQIVFDLGGQVFVGTLTPALAAAVTAAHTRLGQAAVGELDREQPCELLVVVGDEQTCRLLGPKGAEDAMEVPARALRVVGLRQGAVFAVAP
jgi:hypothetical protein